MALVVIDANPDAPILTEQVPQQFEPRLHEREPCGMFEIVVVMLKRAAGVVRRIYVPTDFDTIEKAFSGVKTAEKGIKQGLSRSNADFGSPCLLYSVMDFCRSDVRWHRGV